MSITPEAETEASGFFEEDIVEKYSDLIACDRCKGRGGSVIESSFFGEKYIKCENCGGTGKIKNSGKFAAFLTITTTYKKKGFKTEEEAWAWLDTDPETGDFDGGKESWSDEEKEVYEEE